MLKKLRFEFRESDVTFVDAKSRREIPVEIQIMKVFFHLSRQPMTLEVW